MHPTPLMQSLMDVVGGIEVEASHSTVVFADQVFDHFPSTRMMVLIIAKRGGTHRPDVAIEAILSPPRLIRLDGRTGANLPFECIELRLHLLFDPMQQFHNLSTADLDPVQREQVRLVLAN